MDDMGTGADIMKLRLTHRNSENLYEPANILDVEEEVENEDKGEEEEKFFTKP